MSWRVNPWPVTDGDLFTLGDFNDAVSMSIGELNGYLDRDNGPEGWVSDAKVFPGALALVDSTADTATTACTANAGRQELLSEDVYTTECWMWVIATAKFNGVVFNTTAWIEVDGSVEQSILLNASMDQGTVTVQTLLPVPAGDHRITLCIDIGENNLGTGSDLLYKQIVYMEVIR